MFEFEILVIEFLTINRFSTYRVKTAIISQTCAIASCKITTLLLTRSLCGHTLNHKLLDNAMESRTLVMQRLTRFTNPFFTCT